MTTLLASITSLTLPKKLIHGYFDVNLDIVWDTILEDLPPLVKDLKAIPSTENAP